MSSDMNKLIVMDGMGCKVAVRPDQVILVTALSDHRPTCRLVLTHGPEVLVAGTMTEVLRALGEGSAVPASRRTEPGR